MPPLEALSDDARDAYVRNRVSHHNYVFVDLGSDPPVCLHGQDQQGLMSSISVIRKSMGLDPLRSRDRTNLRQKVDKIAARKAKAQVTGASEDSLSPVGGPS